GEDWWFLGAHGFARTEALGWKAGAPLIERSLALEARNAHAAHAWAHVLYERGDDESGARFVEGWIPDYPREAALHCHFSCIGPSSSWAAAVWTPRSRSTSRASRLAARCAPRSRRWWIR